MTILILEDDPDEAFLFSRAAEYALAECQTEFVRDGVEAVAYLQGKSPYSNRKLFPIPDLMLVDLGLPRLGGFEFLEWLQNDNQFKNLPALILTNSAAENDKRHAELLGAKGYFVKPTTSDGLYSLIKKIEQEWLHRK